MIVTPEKDRLNRIGASVIAGLAAVVLVVVSWLLARDATLFFLLLLPASLALSFLLYWSLRRRCRRRLRILREPFPEAWERVLRSHVVFFNALGDGERERFRQLVKVFLDEVRITGIRTQLDDTCRVLVAASAVIPIFGFPDWEYEGLGEILIYPSSFGADFRMEGKPDENILGLVGGERLPGIMVLSKPDLIAGFTNPADRRNVGIHEFAHLVDKADGAVDGVPAGIARDALEPWLRKVREVLGQSIQRRDIRPYGYTSEVEFFAVVAEYFFESPEVMERKRPELYRMLQQIFRQDMKARLRSAVKSMFRRGGGKIPRNAPCPCGSGKKYKRCCLPS